MLTYAITRFSTNNYNKYLYCRCLQMEGHFLILLTVCSQLCKKKKSLFPTYRLYSCVEGHEPVALIIKTLEEEVIIINLRILASYSLTFYFSFVRLKHIFSQVFGAFLSTDVSERRKHNADELHYFGTGECFVFTVRHIYASRNFWLGHAASNTSCEK